MDKEIFENNYWNYYLMLEERFVYSMKYVELAEKNYDTYSLDFVSQIQGTGSELDVVMKEICNFKPTDRKTMLDYAPMIFSIFPNIVNQEVEVIGKNLVIKPFENWDIKKPAESLFWWQKYNSIKHGRVGNYTDANLKNVLYSLTALFVLERCWLKQIADSNDGVDIPIRRSEIFILSNWISKYAYDAEHLSKLTPDGVRIMDGGSF